MMKINFERWLRIPQLAVAPPSPLQRAALAHAAYRRPARLAALVGGAVFCASLAMTAAPADARPASAPAGAGSAEPGPPAMDEFSSRRHGAGSRSSHAGRSSGGRGGILGGARGAFKKSVASHGHAGRHHGGRHHARRPNGEIGVAVSRPKQAGRHMSHAGRSKGGGHRKLPFGLGDGYRNHRFGHQHIAGGVKVGLFKKGTKGFVRGPHKSQEQPSRHRNASLGSYGDRKYPNKQARTYTPGPSYKTRGHKRRTIAGQQPDGGYSYGNYPKSRRSYGDHYDSDKRVKD